MRIDIIKNLEKLRILPRKKYHPLQHKIHKEHKISKRTLFYIKEYGPHSHVSKTIIKESIKILLLASIISSVGGVSLEYIKNNFIALIPLIVLLPILNDMIGDYGIVVSSKFSSMLHEGLLNKKKLFNQKLTNLFFEILSIALLTALFAAILSLIVSLFSNYTFNLLIALKVLLVALLDSMILVAILFFISIYFGLYYYQKEEDPNNFLIPITTSIADFGNMLLLSMLIIIIF